jgi:hypothetical protein
MTHTYDFQQGCQPLFIRLVITQIFYLSLPASEAPQQRSWRRHQPRHKVCPPGLPSPLRPIAPPIAPKTAKIRRVFGVGAAMPDAPLRPESSRQASRRVWVFLGGFARRFAVAAVALPQWRASLTIAPSRQPWSMGGVHGTATLETVVRRLKHPTSAYHSTCIRASVASLSAMVVNNTHANAWARFVPCHTRMHQPDGAASCRSLPGTRGRTDSANQATCQGNRLLRLSIASSQF